MALDEAKYRLLLNMGFSHPASVLLADDSSNEMGMEGLSAKEIVAAIGDTSNPVGAKLSATFAGRGQKLADLPSPWFCGHRGGRLRAPEHSMEAYRMCADAGFAIEAADVRTLADGTLVPLHDSTVDRTLTITGNVSDTSPAAWMQAKIKASSIPGGAGPWGDTCTPPLMSQIAAEFANGPVLVPNPTASSQVAPLIALFKRYGIQKDQVIIAAGGGLSIAQAAVAQGWTASMDTDPATAVANGIQWITGDITTFTQAQVNAAKAAGLKVMLYTANRRVTVDSYTGVDAWYSDDPWYLSRDTRFERKNDAFKSQGWIPGLIQRDSIDSTPRGKFYAPDAWGFDLNAGAIDTVGHFYLAPTDSSAYTFALTLQVDAVNAADTTRGAYIYLGKNDKWFNDQSPTTTDGPDGYLIWLKANGQVNIYRKDYSLQASTTLKSNTAIGAALTLGTPVTYSITVTGTTITVARTDAGATTSTSVTDSTYRGLRFIQLGRVGSGCRFSGLSVT